MLKAMKTKLAGGKKPATAAAAQEAPSQPSTSRPPANRQPSTAQAPAPRAAAPAKDPPSLPPITEQSMQDFYAQPLPSFRDVAPSDKQALFIQKLHLCAFTFDFTDPTKHLREKEIKRQTLLELVDYANSGQGKFTEAVSEHIVFMLSQNLFRTLPPSRSHDVDNFDPEEEEPTLEPAWPHLQVADRGISSGMGMGVQ
jgi:serine/threonine-protein phosphatase 2A regulatory subunit B'